VSDWTRQDVIDLLWTARGLVGAGWTQGIDHVRVPVEPVCYKGGEIVKGDLYCLRGALVEAANRLQLPDAAYRAACADVLDVLATDPSDKHCSYMGPVGLVVWNDRAYRKKAEAVALLERAAMAP
jgi:hypothetical protein